MGCMQGVNRVSGASPVAFPAMTPIPAAPLIPLTLGRAAAVDIVHAVLDGAAVASDEEPMPPRTIQQGMVCSHSGPSGLEAAAAASMAMPEKLCEPVQMPRRARRQTTVRGQPAAPDLDTSSAAAVAAPDSAPAVAMQKAVLEEASTAAQLATVEDEPVEAQEMPRRTRRQTMASGALVQLPGNCNGAAAAGSKRRGRQTQAGLVAFRTADMAPVGDGVPAGAMPCISEEVCTDTAVPVEPVRSPQVPQDSGAQLAGELLPGALGGLLCGGVQPGAAAVARRTRRQTMAALAKPADRGRSLLSSGARQVPLCNPVLSIKFHLQGIAVFLFASCYDCSRIT